MAADFHRRHFVLSQRDVHNSDGGGSDDDNNEDEFPPLKCLRESWPPYSWVGSGGGENNGETLKAKHLHWALRLRSIHYSRSHLNVLSRRRDGRSPAAGGYSSSSRLARFTLSLNAVCAHRASVIQCVRLIHKAFTKSDVCLKLPTKRRLCCFCAVCPHLDEHLYKH